MAQYTDDELNNLFNIEAAPAFEQSKLNTDQQQALRDIWRSARQAADLLVRLTPDDDPQSREAVDSIYQVALHATAAAVPESEQSG